MCKHNTFYLSRNEMVTALYNRIAIFRAQRGVSRRELAEAVGVNNQTIGYLERGDYKPSLELAMKIAALFRRSDRAALFLSALRICRRHIAPRRRGGRTIAMTLLQKMDRLVYATRLDRVLFRKMRPRTLALDALVRARGPDRRLCADGEDRGPARPRLFPGVAAVLRRLHGGGLPSDLRSALRTECTLIRWTSAR